MSKENLLFIENELLPPSYGQVILTGSRVTDAQWVVPNRVNWISVVCVGCGTLMTNSNCGGGVGLYGEGASGGPGTSDTTLGRPGKPGSGGSGSTYGGGGSGYSSGGGSTVASPGAIRIIWGPEERFFPSTNTQDM